MSGKNVQGKNKVAIRAKAGASFGRSWRASVKSAFTLIELLVVVSIIAILAGLLLPALNMARERGRSSLCTSNLKQIGLAMNLYVNDWSVYPTVRWGTGTPQTRWPLAIGDQIGGSVLNPLVYSTATGTNVFTNNVFKCPSIRRSKFQLDEARFPGKKREDYARDGSYGYNWAPFGPFHLRPFQIRHFPVRPSAIKAPSSTIMIGDAFGEKAGTATTGAPHAYTLDGPVRLNGRWGIEPGGQTPADPRHGGRRFNAVYGDGHTESHSYSEAGYDANIPSALSGLAGDPKLWNGYADSTITVFTE